MDVDILSAAEEILGPAVRVEASPGLGNFLVSVP